MFTLFICFPSIAASCNDSFISNSYGYSFNFVYIDLALPITILFILATLLVVVTY
ncbi:MAG: hypothetical protein GX682_03550 [Clostridiaceae bacterium]|nr:hypothetical protein [Clostridiaceae bacterium]